MFVTLGCAFKSIAKRSRDCEESLRAVVPFGVDVDYTVDVLILILPGRLEGKANLEFVDKFRSGSIFSVCSPCGEVGE